MDDKTTPTNDLFHDDADGCVYRQVSGRDDEPLYILKLYGFEGTDPRAALDRWTELLMARERGVVGREVKVYVSIRGRKGFGRGSVSVPTNYLAKNSVANLVASVVSGLGTLADVAMVRVSFFRPRLRGAVAPQVQPSGSDIMAAVQRVERRVEAVAPIVQAQLSELHQELVRRTRNYEGNYAQAADELGIPHREAMIVVLDNMRN